MTRPTSCSRTARASTARSARAEGHAVGEVVFTTGMSGYQESMTDPSFAGQLITFTYPAHRQLRRERAGDGVRARLGARGDHARGGATARTRRAPSAAGWTGSTDCGVPAISGVDTRALVRHIREAGAMRGGVFPGAMRRGSRRAS